MKGIYKTANGYFYNMNNNKLFKLNSEAEKLIEIITDEESLNYLYNQGSISEEIFRKLHNVLFNKTNYCRNIKSEIEKQNRNLNKLQLIVVNGCNMRCKYCYADAGTYYKKVDSMGIEEGKAIIDYFYRHYNTIRAITFFGGEPLLNIDVIDYLCEYIKKNYNGRYKQFYMMSNLLCLSQKAIDVISRHNIKITTSLDGNELCNDENRIDKNGKGTFERVSKNIKTLQKKTGQPEAIEATLSSIHNKYGWSAQDVGRFLRENFDIKYYSTIEVKEYKNANVGAFKEVQSYDSYVNDCIDEYIRNGIVTHTISKLMFVIKGMGISDFFCDAGLGQFTVMPNGDVYPCQIFSLADNDKYKITNVIFDTEREINKENRIKQELINYSKENIGKCKECDARNICSICIGNVLVRNNSFELDDTECQEIRNHYYLLIEAYSDLYADKEKWHRFIERVKEDKEKWVYV